MKTKNKFSRTLKRCRWINTRFSLPYKKRVLFANIASSTILSIGKSNINAIKCTVTKSPKDKVLKAIAIVNEVVSTMQNTCLAFQGLTQPQHSNIIGIK